MFLNEWRLRQQSMRDQNAQNQQHQQMQRNQHLHPQQQVARATLPNPRQMGAERKLKWGPPIWTFFHVLAQKVDAEKFSTLRAELIEMIRNICGNLPCPDCTAHASSYMAKVNWSMIRTKEDLINMLFVFHNSVNQRKGYPQFDAGQLAVTYGGRNMAEVLGNFFHVFEDRHSRGPNSAIATKFHRIRLSDTIKRWFVMNLQHFNV
jgi:hypothetical protein